MEQTLLGIAQKINAYLSDYILIVLLIGVGLFYSIRTRFVQIRCFGEGMKRTFGGIFAKKEKNKISSYGALATAIAAQVGTGNIVGASGAILLGGPGAIFWMWIIAFFGMATIYSEAVLAQETKVKGDDGVFKGGPVYYIKKAFTGKFGTFLAAFFAVAVVLALGFMGSMVQLNSIAESANKAFGIDTWIVGLVVTLICALIYLGGAKRIVSVAEKIVPVMAVLYIVGGLIVLGVRYKYLPETFSMIFKYAFTPDAMIGGGIGYALKTAISQGAKRGLFSNEAGMGSTPHAHALADVKKPHDQGVVAMIGVFVDTFVVLNITAFVVISTLYAGNGPLGAIAGENYVADIATTGLAKTNMMQEAYHIAFPNLPRAFGDGFVSICLLFFAFTTIIGWNLFGKINFEHLFGKKSLVVYFVVALVFTFMGSVIQNDLAWELTDMFNNLMVIPNVIALFALSGMVVKNVKSAKQGDRLDG